MKPKELNSKLIEIAQSIGFRIKRDNGNFRGGDCILFNEKIIVLNKNLPFEEQNIILATAIEPFLNDIYVKPNIRELISSLSMPERNNIQIFINNKEDGDGS